MVKLEDGEFGRVAIVNSIWTRETTHYLLANNVLELDLNYTKGWRGSDLSFLKELRHLRAFRILDWEIPSVAPIHFLHELRALKVITNCKTEIRFSEFPQLEECELEWRSKAASIFSCITLRKLFLNRYSKKDVHSFSTLVNLESLAILNAPIRNLLGLRTLWRLRSLRLGNLRQLRSLAGIEGLSALEELNVDTCRAITSIDEVGYISRLRKLCLDNCGEIESLKPLGKLSGLESMGFVESTKIRDGDLSPLLHQKNLSRVSFQNRRHYTHKREEFGAAFFGSEYMKKIKIGAKPLSMRELVKKTESPRGVWQRMFSR